MSVIIKITDGLGNQLFQYAYGRALAEKLNCDLKFDLSWYNQTEERFTKRNYLLDNFKINASIATSIEIQKLKLPQFPIIFNSIYYRWQYILPYFKRDYIKEKTFQYDSNLSNIRKKTYLEGFWQSYLYFKDIRPQLLKEIILKNSLNRQAIFYKNTIEHENAVMVHVRRGDYTNRVKNPEHILQPINYYNRALEHIISKINRPHFFVFSDDLNWVKSNINIPEKTTYIDGNILNPVEDLILMSLCKHHIIANSSFSWWGAWLSTNEEKLVIAPQKWFSESSSKNTKDLIPPEWEKL